MNGSSTAQENANFKSMIGQSFLGNERQFLAALRAMRRVNEEGLVGSGRQEAGLREAEERGKPKSKTETTDTQEETEEDRVNREFRELF